MKASKLLIYTSAATGVIAFLLPFPFMPNDLSSIVPVTYAFSWISVALLLAGVLIYRWQDSRFAWALVPALFWPLQYVLIVVGCATLGECL